MTRYFVVVADRRRAVFDDPYHSVDVVVWAVSPPEARKKVEALMPRGPFRVYVYKRQHSNFTFQYGIAAEEARFKDWARGVAPFTRIEPQSTPPEEPKEEVPHEPVTGLQAGLLGVPDRIHVQKRVFRAGQMEIESYQKYQEAMKPKQEPKGEMTKDPYK